MNWFFLNSLGLNNPITLKYPFVFCTLILWFFDIEGQTINWQWARDSRGGNDQEGYASAVDKNGNIYITGYFTADTVRFGNTTLFTPGFGNLFLAKYSATGNLLWAKTSEFKGNTDNALAIGTGIAIDSNNNVYLTGYSDADTILFDSIVVPNYSPGNIINNFFVCKYDSSGHAIWARGGGGLNNGAVEGSNLCTDAKGNVIATGYINNGSIIFGDTAITVADTTGIYIVKYDNSGNILWVTVVGGGFNQYVLNEYQYGISTDSGGSIYLSGLFQGNSVSLGPFTLTSSLPSYYSKGFIVKYSPNGSAVWANLLDGDLSEYGNAIEADNSGNIYVTSGFDSDTLNLGSIRLAHHGLSYYTCWFLAKYDNRGNVQWAKNSNLTSDYSVGYNIAFDANDDVYLVGGFYGDSIMADSIILICPALYSDPMFLLVFKPDGKAIGGFALGSGGDDQCTVNINPAGDVYIGGDFRIDPFVLGMDSLRQLDSMSENVFVAKFDFSPCLTGSGRFGYQINLQSLCRDDSALISFTNGSGFSISPGGYAIWVDSLQAFLKPDTTTVFTISGYSVCNVFQSQLFTLPVITGSVTIASNRDIMCSGDTAQICATSGFLHYNWSNTDSSECINTTLPGNYIVTVTAGGNCTSTSNGLTLNLYGTSPVALTISGDTITTLNSGTYQWYLNGSAIQGADSSVYIVQIPGTYSLQVIDSNGCKLTSGLENIAGLPGERQANAINIYPNPSPGIWHLSVANSLCNGILEAFSNAGQSVFKSVIKAPDFEISMPTLANGIYELRIVSSDYRIVKKLVKM